MRGSYLGQAGSAIRVKFLRKTQQDPREYAVLRRTGGTRKTHTLTAKQLLETLDMDENEVLIADRGNSPGDAVKVEVAGAKKQVRKVKNKKRKKKKPPIKVGDVFQEHDTNIEHTVTSVSGKTGKTVRASDKKWSKRYVLNNRVVAVGA